MGPTGKAIFLTKGVGRHREKLTSFELALRDARIAEFNLVRVSSIFPPGCKVISIQDGLKTLTPGQIVYTVMYDNSTDEPHRLMATSVGLAIPADKDQYGYLSEHKSFGQTDEKAGDYAEDLAATMLATALGVDFDPNVSYDERKDVWKLSDKIVQTRNITQSAIGDRDGLWTTVVTAAVFVNLPATTSSRDGSQRPRKADHGSRRYRGDQETQGPLLRDLRRRSQSGENHRAVRSRRHLGRRRRRAASGARRDPQTVPGLPGTDQLLAA